MEWVESVARWIEYTGAAAIAVGGLAATVDFLVTLGRRRGFESSYHRYRTNLGRAILLGLEFLVAGDIIATILVEPSLESVGVLAIIVLIRTFLSFSLQTEIDGQLPWRKNAGPARSDPA